MLVGKRRRLLRYLERSDLERYRHWSRARSSPLIEAGEPAPEFTLPQHEGQPGFTSIVLLLLTFFVFLFSFLCFSFFSSVFFCILFTYPFCSFFYLFFFFSIFSFYFSFFFFIFFYFNFFYCLFFRFPPTSAEHTANVKHTSSKFLTSGRPVGDPFRFKNSRSLSEAMLQRALTDHSAGDTVGKRRSFLRHIRVRNGFHSDRQGTVRGCEHLGETLSPRRKSAGGLSPARIPDSKFPAAHRVAGSGGPQRGPA